MPLEEAIAAAFTKFAESSLGDNKPANIEDTTGASFILADYPSNSICTVANPSILTWPRNPPNNFPSVI